MTLADCLLRYDIESMKKPRLSSHAYQYKILETLIVRFAMILIASAHKHNILDCSIQRYANVDKLLIAKLSTFMTF